MRNFTAHFIMDVITYPCWDKVNPFLVNEAPYVF